MNQLRASIDIGSNSILLLIGKFIGDKFEQLYSDSIVTSLGYKLDELGHFHEESMRNSMEVFLNYRKKCDEFGVEPNNIIATATEASRVASNAKDFFDSVYENTQIEVTIITSDAEAYYSANGILFDRNESTPKEIFVMDIGGASSEIIHLNTKNIEIKNDFSFPMGAVRATNWNENKVLEQNIERIYNDFKKNIDISQTKILHCVAGTMTSVANLFINHQQFDEVKVNGYELSVKDIKDIYKDISGLNAQSILEKYPFLKKRSKTIVGGIYVALKIFDWLGVEDVIISTYGLRYGTIREGFIKDEYRYRK
ncbi:MAG: hypothetical protein N4A33_10085 [Bacteriovoracaceae bacterium]|jgi:exopolyphosphatase/guanosine-5'-triphosphate,3'-diphosphate pyrophosphatase|nr:hypothetical protein [Bacteriovoracaceae bacterium]